MRPAFVVSTLLYLVIMVIAAALFVSFGYKLIFKEDSSTNPSNQVPPDVQDQKADTVDETANWKTYLDPKGAFSFKYPPNLVPQSIFDRELISFMFYDKEKLVLRVRANNQNKDLKETYEKLELKDTKKEYERTSINGYEALLTRIKWPCQDVCNQDEVKNEQYHVDLKGNNIIVGFKINTLDKEAGTSVSDEKWLNQILSTFRFTD